MAPTLLGVIARRDSVAALGRAWTKAASSLGTNCVELAPADTGVLVRDSKDPQGPWLRYTNSEFRAFLDAAKMGEFDHLV